MATNDLNRVTVIGNLTRDCGSNERDYGYTPNGFAVARISIAVNGSKKKADGTYESEVSYFDVNIWGKTAENLKPYLLKGTKVAIDGKLKQDRWQDKNTGNNMSRVYINAETVELLGGKREQEPQNQSAYAQQYQKQQSEQPPINEGVADMSYGGDFPEDIPF